MPAPKLTKAATSKLVFKVARISQCFDDCKIPLNFYEQATVKSIKKQLDKGYILSLSQKMFIDGLDKRVREVTSLKVSLR